MLIHRFFVERKELLDNARTEQYFIKAENNQNFYSLLIGFLSKIINQFPYKIISHHQAERYFDHYAHNKS